MLHLSYLLSANYVIFNLITFEKQSGNNGRLNVHLFFGAS